MMHTARSFGTLLLLAVLPAFQGNDRPNDRPDRDPPSRVGRLSYLTGSVSFRPGDVDDWVAATVNYPLHDGDHLWTDSDARAEITVGSTAFRLAPQSAFGFLALDDRTLQVRLSQGSLNVRVRDLGDDESLEIDTPSGAVSLLRAGVYRVDVDTTGDTTSITVRKGEAEVTAAGSAFPVHRDQTALVAGGDAPTYDVREAIRSDDFDDWCGSRDRRLDDSRSSRYVSRGMIGYEDLDDNGDWQETADYGAVWVPRHVATGWAPYRYGHWAWVEPWGWTWIDDAPWGFAPFHYGRWVYIGDGWAWVPGHVVARPVYAPALVVFVGGRNWSVAIGAGGGGGVAWFPLAPEEPYVPAYHVSNTYIRNVNVTNVNITNVNVTNINVTNINYRNRRERDAVTVVSHDAFVESRPVNREVIVVPRDRLDRATVVGATAHVAPIRRSVLGQPAIIAPRRPPPRVETRSVIAERQPPPLRVPFAAREQALRSHPGRPLDDAAVTELRARTPAANRQPLVRPASPAPAPNTGAGRERPAPVLRPTREGLPPPRTVPPSVTAPPPERHAAPARTPAPTVPTPSERPNRPERPTRPAPTAPREQRPAAPPAERPAPPPTRAQPQPNPPERRPAPEQRPSKERKAARDTTKEKKPS
jgi:uncharacterized protein DUF6600/FecR-like protein